MGRLDQLNYTFSVFFVGRLGLVWLGSALRLVLQFRVSFSC